MNENEVIDYIQERLLICLDRLDKEKKDLKSEVARSNAISKLANTYINTCNMKIRLKNEK